MILDDARAVVGEAIRLTGAEPPEMLEAGAPVLGDDVVKAEGEGGFYIIGLIGGKNVGKSAFVNAVIGREASRACTSGRGTDRVIAYVHEASVGPVRSLLERLVPGAYEVIAHDTAGLTRQVLVDLPDIDSHYEAHVEITRRMLRHMLYPIWMQSVEKYADARAQELLRRVAAGNSPENFLFLLNKADQLRSSNGDAAPEALRGEYAGRLGLTLQLEAAPKVWVVSATHPGEFDFPGLRKLLASDRPTDLVERARSGAARRQACSLLEWVKEQRLEEQLGRVERLERDAEETVMQRLGTPLIERVLPAMMESPAMRLSLIEELMNARVRRWPIVNILHTVADPLVSFARYRLSGATYVGGGRTASFVAEQLRVDGQPLGQLVRAVFAQLEQTHPALKRVAEERQAWRPEVAEALTRRLEAGVAEVLERQRAALRERVAGRGWFLAPVVRWVLTLGGGRVVRGGAAGRRGAARRAPGDGPGAVRRPADGDDVSHQNAGVPDAVFRRTVGGAALVDAAADGSAARAVAHGGGYRSGAEPAAPSADVAGDAARTDPRVARAAHGGGRTRGAPAAGDRRGGGVMTEGHRRRWDSNPRITDLQSVPLVHLGTPPGVRGRWAVPRGFCSYSTLAGHPASRKRASVVFAHEGRVACPAVLGRA